MVLTLKRDSESFDIFHFRYSMPGTGAVFFASTHIDCLYDTLGAQFDDVSEEWDALLDGTGSIEVELTYLPRTNH